MAFRRFRKQIDKAAELLADVAGRWSKQDILDACQQQDPSDYLSTGGLVLEAWLDFAAPYQVHRKWRGFQQRKDDDGDPQALSEDEMDDLLDVCANLFATFFVNSLSTQGGKGKQQILYRTMYARYHGASRSAVDTLARGGLLTPLTTYDREVKIIHNKVLDDVKQASARPHTVWLDNFSKIYSMRMPSLNEGAYAMCHWTGRAIRVSKEDFDVSVVRDNAGDVIPAMPDDLFQEQPRLTQMMGPLPHVNGVSGMYTYATSKVISWKVFNVPPRPSPNTADLKYFAILKEHCDTVKQGNFIPTGMLRQNINENEGLCTIIREHYERNNMHIRGALECKEYSHLSTDMAIFWRILKLQYDMSGGGKYLRMFMSNTLAWWHTYKHCVIEIWRKWANTLWAPLWHHLYPNSKFYLQSTSMPAMVMHFMFVLLAWPDVKPVHAQAMAAANLTAAQRVLLQDFEFLCEFAIPQTLDYYIYMKVNDGGEMFNKLFALLRLQLLLTPHGGQRQYIWCTISQLLILLHQRRHNLPAWQMLTRDASMFNEETGEMSFSILSRCVQEEQMKAKFEHLDTMYRMVPFIMSVEDDVVHDSKANKSGPAFNWRRVAKKDSEVVLSITLYLKQMCRSTAMGVRKQYNGKNKDSKCYKNQAEGNKNWEDLSKTVQFWREDVTLLLAGDLLAAKNHALTNFGCDQRHIWPEMKYNLPLHGGVVVPNFVLAPQGQLQGGEDAGEEEAKGEGQDFELPDAAAAVAAAVAAAADHAEDEDDDAMSHHSGKDDEEAEGDEGDEGDQNPQSSEEDDDDEDGWDEMSHKQGKRLYKGDKNASNKKPRTAATIFRHQRKNRGNKGFDKDHVYYLG